MKTIKNFLRFILFIIAVVFVIASIFGGLAFISLKLMPWFFDLSLFWRFIAIFFLSGIIGTIINLAIRIVMYFIVQIPSNKELGHSTLTAIAGLNAIFMIYRTWTLPDEYYNLNIIMTIFFNIIILAITFSIIANYSKALDEEIL